jgi:predicted cobalt transporter CbtA
LTVLARLDFTRPRTIVVAAMLIGVLSGVGGAVFHSVVTEPRVDEAVALESRAGDEADAHADGAGDAHTDEADADDEVVVSRRDQKGAGLFLAYALIGAAYGLVLAITSLSLRTTTGGPFRRVVVSGTILAGAIAVAPWLKYPPNPPGVGDPDTVGERERLWLLLIVLAGLLLAGVAHLSGRLRTAGWPDDRRVGALAAAGAVAAGLLFTLMPTSPTRLDVPAGLVWHFRLNSLTGNLLMWALLTVGLAMTWTEALRRAGSAAPLGPTAGDDAPARQPGGHGGGEPTGAGEPHGGGEPAGDGDRPGADDPAGDRPGADDPVGDRPGGVDHGRAAEPAGGAQYSMPFIAEIPPS